MFPAEEIKKRVGVFAADLVNPHSVIGMGTGSTIYWLINELGERQKQGLNLTIVPTSNQTAELALKKGIAVASLNDHPQLSLTIDGADEIDPSFQLIKGGGGALLMEKMVALASKELVIIADESKLVNQLGKFPLPVEVIPAGWKPVQQKIMQIGCPGIQLRKKGDEIFVTDTGHYILDCAFEKIENAVALNTALHLIPGVVETGLFVNMVSKIIIGNPDGGIVEKER